MLKKHEELSQRTHIIFVTALAQGERPKNQRRRITVANISNEVGSVKNVSS
jgi:hypothetical protein